MCKNDIEQDIASEAFKQGHFKKQQVKGMREKKEKLVSLSTHADIKLKGRVEIFDRRGRNMKGWRKRTRTSKQEENKERTSHHHARYTESMAVCFLDSHMMYLESCWLEVIKY